MSDRLPPLNALRAFEAAARHRSFKRAAEELFVTPAAISQQVKSLEGYLGVELFRSHSGVPSGGGDPAGTGGREPGCPCLKMSPSSWVRVSLVTTRLQRA